MNTNPRSKRSRREFLCETSVAAAGVGAGVLVKSDSAAAAGEAEPNIQRVSRIETGAKQARRLAVDSQGTVFVAADRAIMAFAGSGMKLGTWETEKAPRCVVLVDGRTLAVGFRRHVELYNISRGGLLSVSPRQPLPPLGEESLMSSLASDGEHLYVADAGAKTIWKLSLAGEVIARIDGPGGKFHAPAEYFSIALGTGSDLHAVHPGRHRVEKYSTGGEMLSKWGANDRTMSGFGGCCNPVALTTLPNGQTVTAERGQPRIKLFAADGTFLTQLAGPEDYAKNQSAARNDNGLGCNRGGFDLASDRRGKLFVLDRVTGAIDVFA